MSEDEWNLIMGRARSQARRTGKRVYVRAGLLSPRSIRITGRRWTYVIMFPEPTDPDLPRCERVSFACTNENVSERVQPSANPFSPIKTRTVCPECFEALQAMALDEELSNR